MEGSGRVGRPGEGNTHTHTGEKERGREFFLTISSVHVYKITSCSEHE